MNVDDFQETIWQKGGELYRTMPWREDTSPYSVLVSELMLQQTQVERVIPKFQAFMVSFPTVQDLASATLEQVLQHWSGLGYNRRAQYLWRAARMVVDDFAGVFPDSFKTLVLLPGVGKNTAGALLAYSFNQPVAYIETNVRTVYFYHFFENQDMVTDAELLEVVEETVDREHPREWYWALMDYGAFLKKQGAGQNNKSAHYKKQAPLKGSLREVRGQIIKQLTKGDASEEALRESIAADQRFEPALEGLLSDGLIARTDQQLHLNRETGIIDGI